MFYPWLNTISGTTGKMKMLTDEMTGIHTNSCGASVRVILDAKVPSIGSFHFPRKEHTPEQETQKSRHGHTLTLRRDGVCILPTTLK